MKKQLLKGDNMNINIPNAQVYTMEQFAHDLMNHFGWRGYSVATEDADCIYDLEFIDKDGQVKWMTLDGKVYDNPDCAEPEVDTIDYRAELNRNQLVWVFVPHEVYPFAAVGIIP